MIEVTGLSANTWHDLYAAAGLAVGTPIIIYNKSASSCLLWEGASAPGQPTAGVPLGLDEPVVVSEDVAGLWIRGMVVVSVNVQEIE